ncbi:uncharacterized protein LOC115995959 [Ipomoea triloba]|uniref:uncharacterized protein LOC115995959 n=1 Tax=Ipomoea triloba TaxID=35885 RepID=UPI00125DEBEC|nr:uncharacterized protein LOC115995959 [Ipomoea triloba]
MRKLFVILLTLNLVIRPKNVWMKCDITFQRTYKVTDGKYCKKKESQKIERQLTDEQTIVYDTILKDVSLHKGGLYFVYGYGVTRKTFVWKALSAKLRSKGDIVINVTSSGIASLLLPGGKLHTPNLQYPSIALNEDSTCNISQCSHLAKFIIRTKLIIWDEVAMMHKHCFEALDRTMRNLKRFKDP